MDDPELDKPNKPRRDFLFVATGAVAAMGVVAIARPLLGHMSPAADNVAKIGIDIDVRPIAEGQKLMVRHGIRPVLIWHRTPEQIAAARADDGNKALPDPATDQSRLEPKPDGAYDPRYLIVQPICTHFDMGLVVGQGRFDGFYCPSHGANYDLSGRIRSQPAETNLRIPPYRWINDHTINLMVLRGA